MDDVKHTGNPIERALLHVTQQWMTDTTTRFTEQGERLPAAQLQADLSSIEAALVAVEAHTASQVLAWLKLQFARSNRVAEQQASMLLAFRQINALLANPAHHVDAQIDLLVSTETVTSAPPVLLLRDTRAILLRSIYLIITQQQTTIAPELDDYLQKLTAKAPEYTLFFYFIRGFIAPKNTSARALDREDVALLENIGRRLRELELQHIDASATVYIDLLVSLRTHFLKVPELSIWLHAAPDQVVATAAVSAQAPLLITPLFANAFKNALLPVLQELVSLVEGAEGQRAYDHKKILSHFDDHTTLFALLDKLGYQSLANEIRQVWRDLKQKWQQQHPGFAGLEELAQIVLTVKCLVEQIDCLPPAQSLQTLEQVCLWQKTLLVTESHTKMMNKAIELLVAVREPLLKGATLPKKLEKQLKWVPGWLDFLAYDGVVLAQRVIDYLVDNAGDKTHLVALVDAYIEVLRCPQDIAILQQFNQAFASLLIPTEDVSVSSELDVSTTTVEQPVDQGVVVSETEQTEISANEEIEVATSLSVELAATTEVMDFVYPEVVLAAAPELDDDLLAELAEVFQEEAEGELLQIEESLTALNVNSDNKEAFASLRRSYHTLKGSGRMVGLMVLGELAWSVERVLNSCRDGALVLTPDILEFANVVRIPVVNALKGQDEMATLREMAWRADQLLAHHGVLPTQTRIMKDVAEAIVTQSIQTNEIVQADEAAHSVHTDETAQWPQDPDTEQLTHSDEVSHIVAGLDQAPEISVVPELDLSSVASAERVENEEILQEKQEESVKEPLFVDMEIYSDTMPIIDDAVVAERKDSAAFTDAELDFQPFDFVKSDNSQPLSAVSSQSNDDLADDLARIENDYKNQQMDIERAQSELSQDVVREREAVARWTETVEEEISIDVGDFLPTHFGLDEATSIEEKLAVSPAVVMNEVDDPQVHLEAVLDQSTDVTVIADNVRVTPAEGLKISSSPLQDPVLQEEISAALIACQAGDLSALQNLTRLLKTLEMGDDLSEPERKLSTLEQPVVNHIDIPQVVTEAFVTTTATPFDVLAEQSDYPARDVLLNAFAQCETGSPKILRNFSRLLAQLRDYLLEQDAKHISSQLVAAFYRDLLHYRAQGLTPRPASLALWNESLTLLIDYVEGGMVNSDDMMKLSVRYQQNESAGFVPLLDSAAENSDSIPLKTGQIQPTVDDELYHVFLAEAGEILESNDALLAQWKAEGHSSSSTALEELRRGMHTVKGSSRMVGRTDIGTLAHALESLLEPEQIQRFGNDERHFETLQRAMDHIGVMLERSGAQADPEQRRLLAALHVLLGNEQPVDHDAPAQDNQASAVVTPVSRQTAQAAQSELGALRIEPQQLQELTNGVAESTVLSSRLNKNVHAINFSMNELGQTIDRLRGQSHRLEIETEAQMLFRNARTTDIQHDFDPLELDRFSELQQLSRAMLETVEDLVSLQQALGKHSDEISTTLEHQAELQQGLLQMLTRVRTMSFTSIVPRLRRLMRQVAKEQGKKVELNTDGTGIQIERTLLEQLIAPLEHMLRNCIFHGIETPDVRQALNKPETGLIRIELKRQGAELILSVSDDGAGLDMEAIRAKALERGLIEEYDSLTDDALARLILLPNFSTATQVSEVAGRGVGLDVLSRALKVLHARLNLHNRTGRGVRFDLHIPFSLTVAQALMVQTGNTVFAVPLLSIEGIGYASKTEMRDGVLSYVYGGEVYPVRHLAAFYDLPSEADLPADNKEILLLARTDENRVAMCVDRILGQQEVIVKPLTPQLSDLIGLSGAAVMPDGQVLFTLDLTSLLYDSSLYQAGMADVSVAPATAVDIIQEQSPLILVVDDSITMRKVSSRMLDRHGLRVLTAKDGIDALEILENEVPDLVMLDIEMPRMDGFEVLSHIRSQAKLNQVPVVMVTSRSGEKHRQRAFSLGASEYCGKPYQESHMLDVIKQLLGSKWQRHEEMSG